MGGNAWNKDPVLKTRISGPFAEVMKTAGELKQKAPYDKVITTEYAEKTIKDVKK